MPAGPPSSEPTADRSGRRPFGRSAGPHTRPSVAASLLPAVATPPSTGRRSAALPREDVAARSDADGTNRPRAAIRAFERARSTMLRAEEWDLKERDTNRCVGIAKDMPSWRVGRESANCRPTTPAPHHGSPSPPRRREPDRFGRYGRKPHRRDHAERLARPLRCARFSGPDQTRPHHRPERVDAVRGFRPAARQEGRHRGHRTGPAGHRAGNGDLEPCRRRQRPETAPSPALARTAIHPAGR